MKHLGLAVVASIGLTMATLASFIAGLIDESDVTTWASLAGSSGITAYVGWRVWSDSRAMNAVQKTLREQIETLSDERDHWRSKSDESDAEILRLSVELARHKE